MKVNRKSWHYKVYTVWAKEKENEDRCGYGRRVILTILSSPFILFCLLCVGLIIALGWFFGRWPNLGKYEEASSDSFHSKYKFDGKNYHRFAPWEFVIPIAIVGILLYFGITETATSLTVLKWVGIIASGIAVVAGLIFLICKGWETETWKLARAYLSDKKRKICPLVTFEGEKKE